MVGTPLRAIIIYIFDSAWCLVTAHIQFSLIKKIKTGLPEHSRTPQPPTSDNISFFPAPPPPPPYIKVDVIVYHPLSYNHCLLRALVKSCKIQLDYRQVFLLLIELGESMVFHLLMLYGFQQAHIQIVAQNLIHINFCFSFPEISP